MPNATVTDVFNVQDIIDEQMTVLENIAVDVLKHTAQQGYWDQADLDIIEYVRMLSPERFERARIRAQVQYG